MIVDRVGPRQLVWRLHPSGGIVAVVAVPRDEAPRLIARGWLKINGERAVIEEARPNDEEHNMALRILFDRPYPDPHP